jgi:hypothetical protein
VGLLLIEKGVFKEKGKQSSREPGRTTGREQRLVLLFPSISPKWTKKRLQNVSDGARVFEPDLEKM